MGNMKTWLIFGFRWWGGLRPSKKWKVTGECYKPLVFGLWIRDRKNDGFHVSCYQNAHPN
jgi:hypothetical protein